MNDVQHEIRQQPGSAKIMGHQESRRPHGRALPAIALVVLCVATGRIWALDRMGPAAAGLGQGKFSADIDYAWSQTDLKASGRSVVTSTDMSSGSPVVNRVSRKNAFTMKNVDLNRLYASLGYGLVERIDVFLRVGGAQTDWTDDGGTHLALNGGVRATFYEAGPWQIGGLAQVGWTEAEFDDASVPMGNGDSRSMKAELSLWEIQLAVAASYRVAPGVSVYGGPFLYFADGQLDAKSYDPFSPIPEVRDVSTRDSYDIKETSRLGGYVGTNLEITPQVSWGIEYQRTADADAVTTGAIWRF